MHAEFTEGSPFSPKELEYQYFREDTPSEEQVYREVGKHGAADAVGDGVFV